MFTSFKVFKFSDGVGGAHSTALRIVAVAQNTHSMIEMDPDGYLGIEASVDELS